MFLILNRLRGTYSWFAKINGVVLGLLVYFFTKELDIAIACSFGYIIGESFGWGEWVGNLCDEDKRKNNITQLEGEGKNNGIQYIATRLVPNWSVAYLKYCRVALVLRGIYWWLPTLAPLYFVGFNPLVILVCVAVLSVGFPLACELGYYFSDKISFEKYGVSFRGGWELQEGFYGILQDLVFGGMTIWMLMN